MKHSLFADVWGSPQRDSEISTRMFEELNETGIPNDPNDVKVEAGRQLEDAHAFLSHLVDTL